MSTIAFPDGQGGWVPSGLIACDHCGIVALDTPRFGWKRWEPEEVDGIQGYLHHCPTAAELNSYLARSMLHGHRPEDAAVYEDWKEDGDEDRTNDPASDVDSESVDLIEGLIASQVVETNLPAVPGEPDEVHQPGP